MNASVRDLQILFEVGSLAGISDGQLLDRFVGRRERAVFELIVHRHGPMVWGVCRRVLRDHHDTEDAFQATFLVLARKASSVRAREKLGHWLYGVAYQTAMKARATRTRRRLREVQVPDFPDPEVVREEQRDDLLPQLDQELSRLPEKYRVPVVLCELEGKTHKEAAEQLGWPIGTVSGRLSRARTILARRLSRGEVTLPVGSLAVLLAQESASASMPTRLIGTTAQAASLFAAGRAAMAGVVSAEVVALLEGVIKTMLLTKLKITTGVLLALALTGIGVIRTVVRASNPPAMGQEPSKVADLTEEESERLQGTWIVTKLEQVDHQPTAEEEEYYRSGKFTINIRGNRITYVIDDSSMLFKLEPSQTPKLMNLEVSDGPNKGQHVPAIYRLDGDDLMICQGRLGDTEPPAGFSIKNRRPGTFPTLWVLRRKQDLTDAARKLTELEDRVKGLRTQLRDAEAELRRAQDRLATGVQKDAVKEREKLRGVWEVVSVEVGGQRQPIESVKSRWIIDDNKITIQTLEKNREVGYTMDGTRVPKSIDMTPGEGPEDGPKGKTFRGIYSLDGDTLKICIAQEGNKRPSDFSTEDSTGEHGNASLTTLWRLK